MTLLIELFLCYAACLVVPLQLHEWPEHLTGTVDKTVTGGVSQPALYIQRGHCIIVKTKR